MAKRHGPQQGNGAARPSPVRSLPLHEWPEADRLGWEAACRPGRRLSPGGAASRMKPVTRDDLARRYGMFLDHLARTGQFDSAAEAAALVTPQAIDGFIAELQARVSSVTVAGTIYKVRRTAELIAPGTCFGWLAEIEKDLALVARPKDKFGRVVATERLVEAGLTLMAEADIAGSLTPVNRALLARNGLMIALLAVTPIRLRNFAALEIGRSFLKQSDSWWIVLDDTKSGRADERPLPAWLNGAIECYLNVYRPVLLGQVPADDTAQGEARMYSVPIRPCRLKQETRVTALWIGRTGRIVGYSQVQRGISDTTQATLGVNVSPHLFRAAGATTAALHAPDMPHLASALLQHRDDSITEEHYNRASSLSVAAQFADLIKGLRD